MRIHECEEPARAGCSKSTTHIHPSPPPPSPPPPSPPPPSPPPPSPPPPVKRGLSVERLFTQTRWRCQLLAPPFYLPLGKAARPEALLWCLLRECQLAISVSSSYTFYGTHTIHTLRDSLGMGAIVGCPPLSINTWALSYPITSHHASHTSLVSNFAASRFARAAAIAATTTPATSGSSFDAPHATASCRATAPGAW